MEIRFRRHEFEIRRYDDVSNPCLESAFPAFGAGTDDGEVMTYGLWSRVRWAECLDLEADGGVAEEPGHET